MGFFSKLGELAKIAGETLVEEAARREELYQNSLEYYERYDKDSLREEYEKLRASGKTDLRTLMRKKAIKDICIERGYMEG